ncbi:hypothetical protein J437_LFUL009008 [Ladona fulva]|uniref:DUF4806 domain-containing protein n=1 Tax=Ladona fulva TaxID=123851 RepID=A0A8K0P3D4_LADFU|nr:hypothetical protein J437_LFUL009008 [Ladona fulva]
MDITRDPIKEEDILEPLWLADSSVELEINYKEFYHRDETQNRDIKVEVEEVSISDECESIADGISDAGRPPRENSASSTQVDSSQLLKILEKMANSMERMENNMKSLSNRVISLEKMQKALFDRCNEGFCTKAHQPQSSTLSSLSSLSKTLKSFNLPINHWDDFLEIMEKVRDDEVKRELITLLSKVGGKDMTSLVNGILLKLLTNSVAMKCNWKGQRGSKHAVEKTPLLSLVHGAVICHVGWENTTEDEVKGRIQNWLKQASRRSRFSEVGEY